MYEEVILRQLTPAGSEVENALADYKEEVIAFYFTTSHVDECPSLKILAKEPGLKDVKFEHPYSGVEEMYSIAEQSQVGTDQKTLFLPDARKSKEFSNIEVLNESWNDKVTTVCDKVQQVLAPGAKKVSAELYKLLIYREGDFFNRHQDAQHSTRMFATLLFFLPVKYTGGEFSMYQPPAKYFSDAESVIVDRKVPNECSWVAFYTDVSHRVSEVKGGSRVVLNYSLSFEGAMSPSQLLLPRLSPLAARILNNYFLTRNKKMLAIPLSYEYTLASLSPDFLKGIDAYVFNAIEKVSLPELYFILRFDKTKVFPRDEDYESDHEQVFQGVFLVNHEIARRYFDILNESERQLAEFEDTWCDRGRRLKKERDGEYLALMKNVKASQGKFDLEWIDYEASRWRNNILAFEHGETGWLGNMTPAEEYYYLTAAIVVHGKRA